MSTQLYADGDAEREAPVKSEGGGEETYRTPWRRDYARLIHSAAFRRLQGKTQLFPSHESDFFRNWLTHSLEVAQVAKSIAIRINATEAFFLTNPIDTDLVETAALAHDLGHPPFGHNGEEALDECMQDAGGFEGNAQTLRILSKLEKRQTKQYVDEIHYPVGKGLDQRAGLNLTYRTLAAVLKYDREIPRLQKDRPIGQDGVVKGYYYTEGNLVEAIKKHVGTDRRKSFKTIECSIMDLADDIAYSTYDLEDSFKARFLTPLSMLSSPLRLINSVALRVEGRIKKEYPEASDQGKFSNEDVYRTLFGTFAQIYGSFGEQFLEVTAGDLSPSAAAAEIASRVAASSEQIATDGYYRTKLTSELVGTFVRAVRVRTDETHPALSNAYLDLETFKKVEVLKNFAYQGLIMSPMLKVAEHRGKDIVKQIFEAIDTKQGHLLMPLDFRVLYSDLKEPNEKSRVTCDFIAGMTDRYAIQFYGRLFGTNPESIYSPL